MKSLVKINIHPKHSTNIIHTTVIAITWMAKVETPPSLSKKKNFRNDNNLTRKGEKTPGILFH